MNRELEDELLSWPIGDLLDFDDDNNNNGVDESMNLNQAQQNYLDTISSPWCDSQQGLQYPLQTITTGAALSSAIPMHTTVASENSEVQKEAPSIPSSSLHFGTTQSPRAPCFINQVFRILEDAQLYNFEHIVSWLPDGISFKVHKIQDFETKILPRYLEQTKVRSFQRQLIKHGFERIQGGASRGAYSHPKFIRDDPKSCLSIEKVKRNRIGDETGTSKDPAVKLGEMSEHFRQAVQESRPLKVKPRSLKKPSWDQHMYQETTEPIATLSNESLKNVVIDTIDLNNQSFSWPSDDSLPSSRQKQDPLAVHRRSSSSTGSGLVSRGWLGKSHSSPGQIEGMHRTLHHTKTTMVSQKIILSKFLPTRLPGHPVLDFNTSDLLSSSTNQVKQNAPTLPTHDFSTFTTAASSSQGERADASFSFRMASTLFDHSSDAEGNFWQG